MCGIVAYLGSKAAQPILIEGLKRLEYRGYDSAGVALLGGGTIRLKKTSGRISALEAILQKPNPGETLGLGKVATGLQSSAPVAREGARPRACSSQKQTCGDDENGRIGTAFVGRHSS